MTWLDALKDTGFYWAVWSTGGSPEVVYFNADLDEVQTFGEKDGYAMGEFAWFWGPLEPPDSPE